LKRVGQRNYHALDGVLAQTQPRTPDEIESKLKRSALLGLARTVRPKFPRGDVRRSCGKHSFSKETEGGAFV